jgi:mannosyltransferase OCH1-like enzyme
MIPKLIHQTFKTADIPEGWRAYQSKVRALHPDWTYRLWTDEDNLAFVKKEYPDFLDTFLKLPKNIMRADVIRYLLLYKLGGLYLDLDYEMLKPFHLNEHEAVLPWETDGEFGPGNDKLCNAFMASSPGHPFFKRLIDELKTNPPLAPDSDVEKSTGPMFISRIYRQTRHENWPIFTPPREVFCPPPPRTPQAHQDILAAGVAHGIHHCTSSWRTYSWPVLLRIHVGQFLRRLVGEKRIESTLRRHRFFASLLGIRR